jgi:hypothetical protein
MMSKLKKQSKKVTTLSAAKRSSIARRAAQSAWNFMRSKPYQAIVNSNRTAAAKRSAIEALKARRAA